MTAVRHAGQLARLQLYLFGRFMRRGMQDFEAWKRASCVYGHDWSGPDGYVSKVEYGPPDADGRQEIRLVDTQPAPRCLRCGAPGVAT